MKKIARAPVNDRELTSAKNILRQELLASCQNPSRLVEKLSEQFVYRLPPFERQLSRLESLTAFQVLQSAQKYLDPKRAVYVVVGSKHETYPWLQYSGFEVETVEELAEQLD